MTSTESNSFSLRTHLVLGPGTIVQVEIAYLININCVVALTFFGNSLIHVFLFFNQKTGTHFLCFKETSLPFSFNVFVGAGGMSMIDIIFSRIAIFFFSHTRLGFPLFLPMLDISFSHTNAYEIE